MMIIVKETICMLLNPIALRTAQTQYSFGRSECNRVEWVPELLCGVLCSFVCIKCKHCVRLSDSHKS